MIAVHIDNLKKRYGSYEALKGVSFDIREGEFFGLLGPNGAGKSTTINILSGILKKDSGEVKIFGREVDDVKFETNVSSAYKDLSSILTVQENLKVYGKLYNVKDIDKRIDHLLKLFEISHLKNTRTHSLSSGEKTRLLLCKGLINNPRLLLLDECTVGLDPDIAQKTRNILKELQEKNKTTILFTSHYMFEVEQLCKKIAFLHKGRILKIDTSHNLKKLIEKQVIEIHFTKDGYNFKPLFKERGIEIINLEKDKISFEMVSKHPQLHELIHSLYQHGFKIKDMDIKKPTLDDIFIKVARDEL